MKVVVVGGGLSGYRCICALRAHYPDAELVLVDKSKTPYNKTVMADWLVDKDNIAFALFGEDFFETNNVSFINDIAVRINFDRKRIFFKEEKSINFDKIILACGLGSESLSFSGQNKEGVYSLWSDDPFQIKTAIKLYQEIVISVSSPMGLMCVKNLIEHYPRDFKILISDAKFLSEDEKNSFVRYAASKGVEVFENTAVLEAIGDTNLKAVKLSIGKFLVANVLICEQELKPEISIFKENDDKLDEGKLTYTDRLQLPDYPDVYFVGNLVNKDWQNKRNYTLTDELRNSTANYVVNSIVKETDEAFDYDLHKETLNQEVSLSELLNLDLSEYALLDNEVEGDD